MSEFRVVEIGIISLRDGLSSGRVGIMKAFIRNLGGLVVRGEWAHVWVRTHACVYAALFIWLCPPPLSHQGYFIWQQGTSFIRTSLVSITCLQNVLFVFLSFHFLIRPLYQLHPKTSHSSSNSTVLFQLAPHDLSHSSVIPLLWTLCIYVTFFFTSCTCIYVFPCVQAIARWFMFTGYTAYSRLVI